MSHPDPLYDPTDNEPSKYQSRQFGKRAFVAVQTTPRFIDLRERREALHVTQAEMAQILEVSRLTYISYEKDFNKIPIGKYLRAEDLIIGLETTKRNLLKESKLEDKS